MILVNPRFRAFWIPDLIAKASAMRGDVTNWKKFIIFSIRRFPLLKIPVVPAICFSLCHDSSVKSEITYGSESISANISTLQLVYQSVQSVATKLHLLISSITSRTLGFRLSLVDLNKEPPPKHVWQRGNSTVAKFADLVARMNST